MTSGRRTHNPIGPAWAGPYLTVLVCLVAVAATATAAQEAALPAPAARVVDFSRDIKPILTASCVRCHARGQAKGGLSIETREALLEGGDMGAAVIPGDSAKSRLLALVAGLEPDLVMPQKGSRLKPEQIALLRAWIDQGVPWDAGVTFARTPPRNLHPKQPVLPMASHETHPIDRLLEPYFANHGIRATVVDDRVFARRVYFDVVGLPPSPVELRAFLADTRPDKRTLLVERLLADRIRYAEHWLTFWNDMLRNDYRGTGYIDGGRRQISAWLYRALVTNMPYDRFVAELVNPVPESEGFSKGIVWRGVVNASQTPQMQAAQNVSQVFMGVNLKCASCHDSFINEWQLADAYGLAGIYANAPLEMVECDRPVGRTAPMKFLYRELGNVDSAAPRAERLKQLAALITAPKNGRLPRTIVNRWWARFMGVGLVEPVDDMEQPAWHPDLLDWLAEDLVANGYDLKKTIERILTSRAYQMPSGGGAAGDAYVFRGPAVRRLSAEQFADALSAVTGMWQPDAAGDFDFTIEGRPLPPLTGRWIRRPAVAPGDTVYFRRAFHVAALPAVAQLIMKYDEAFALYLNGQRVTQSRPSPIARRLNIRPQLRRGTNVLAVAAAVPLRAAPIVDSIRQDALKNPALFVQVLTRQTDRSPLATALSSDATWQTSMVAADGWQRAGFVGRGWRPAVTRRARAEAARPLERLVAIADRVGRARAALATADPLMLALGRPNREQVMTTRSTAATTLQALELSNGSTLSRSLRQGVGRLLADKPTVDVLLDRIYRRALGRSPTDAEAKLCREILGPAVKPEGVEDLLWSIAMLPEFQLIY
jgi:cytochrome c553